MIVGALAAYSLQHFRWPAWVSATFLGWTLVFHMIPVMTLIGPWYVAFRELGLYDTRVALVLAHVTINLPMTVWLMRAFFREVPREIEEAAVVDGCRPFQAFYRVTLPLVVPGLIAAGILAFIFSWNEFPVALSLTSRDLATVPVAIARFAQQYEIQPSQMAAASIIAKTERDGMMEALDREYPGYGFAAHKGYSTPEHRQALQRLGPSAIHRKSFPVMHELQGEYSALFYVLKTQLEGARTRVALDDLETALRVQAAELAEQECKKLKLLVARRWKVIGNGAAHR